MVIFEILNKFTSMDEIYWYPKLFGCNLEPVAYDGSTSIAKTCICNPTNLLKILEINQNNLLPLRWCEYLKYSCSVLARLQQVLVGVPQLVFHIRRTGGSSKMHHHRSPPGCKCCITSNLLNKPSSFIPLIASLSYLVAIKMRCWRLGAPTSKLAGAAHSSSETRPPFN